MLHVEDQEPFYIFGTLSLTAFPILYGAEWDSGEVCELLLCEVVLGAELLDGVHFISPLYFLKNAFALRTTFAVSSP